MVCEKEYIPELVEGIVAIYAASLQSVILYGSVARESETPDSDVDIAIIISEETEKQHDALLDLVTDLNLKYDTVFSALTIDADRYNTWRNVLPFYKNIQKEGIALWTAA